MPISTFIGSNVIGGVTGAIVAGSIPAAINICVMLFAYSSRNSDPSFLFPPKSSPFEIAFCFLVTFAHGFCISYIGAPAAHIVGALSSYSLFSARTPESAVYLDNDQEFAPGSNHYERAISNILLSLALILTSPDGYSWLFIVIYTLHFLGIIAHPFVTLIWAVEQFSIHLLGSSPRSSDSRILMS